MPLATAIDIAVVLVVIGRAVAGLRTGLVAGVVGFIGVAGGAWAGVWAGPQILALVPSFGSNRGSRTLVLVCSVLILSALGDAVSHRIIMRLRHCGKPGPLDAVLGCLASVLTISLLSWFLLSSVRPLAPADIRGAVEQSRSYQVLDEIVPDELEPLPGRFTNIVIAELPRVFGGAEPDLPIAEPKPGVLSSPGVVSASDSIVQILSEAPNCMSDSSGSGWIVAPQRVVTNAHVVAGSSSVHVSVGGVGHRLVAEVVAFDPDLDLAILAVPELTAPALQRESAAQSPGANSVVAGFPYGGPYQMNPARIRGTATEDGANIYGGTGIPREVYAVRGVVRPGNSGGPLLTEDGHVAGTVFARSTVDDQTGYALTDQATAAYLDGASRYTEPVEPGSCLVD